ncbi:hypothetical protein IWX90DRAFT_290969 [Phyllosticta citrichinensis]|uniref:Transmembrane protein n=1 Tax=Phyllosticta citrichinensis TaxID=1130410 RepID=A0ABR1XK17_9PEZI
MCVTTRTCIPCAALIHSSPSSHPSQYFCFAHQSPTASPFTVKSSLTLALRGGSLFMLFFFFLSSKTFLTCSSLSLFSPIKQSVEFIMTFAFSVRWELGSWWGGRVCLNNYTGWADRGERETWLGTTAALTFFFTFLSLLSLQNSSLFALSFLSKTLWEWKIFNSTWAVCRLLRLSVDCRWLWPLLLLLLVRRRRWWRRGWSEPERRCW